MPTPLDGRGCFWKLSNGGHLITLRHSATIQEFLIKLLEPGCNGLARQLLNLLPAIKPPAALTNPAQFQRQICGVRARQITTLNAFELLGDVSHDYRNNRQ